MSSVLAKTGIDSKIPISGSSIYNFNNVNNFLLANSSVNPMARPRVQYNISTVKKTNRFRKNRK